MEDFIEHMSYDENDIEDFEEYLEYYGFEEDSFEDTDKEEEDTDDSEIRELYF